MLVHCRFLLNIDFDVRTVRKKDWLRNRPREVEKSISEASDCLEQQTSAEIWDMYNVWFKILEDLMKIYYSGTFTISFINIWFSLDKPYKKIQTGLY